MSHDVEEIKKHIRTYMVVFVALACLTAVTVRISYFHLSTFPAVALALLVASIKAALVAGFFMHLISEKKTIFLVLLFTVVCFVGLMIIPMLTDLSAFKL